MLRLKYLYFISEGFDNQIITLIIGFFFGGGGGVLRYIFYTTRRRSTWLHSRFRVTFPLSRSPVFIKHNLICIAKHLRCI